jgi:LysR family transcriptional regulator, regulator of abg operon
VTLNQLRDFLAVVQYGGFRAAARSLDISQAGLTKSLSKFEQECGFPLLERRAKGIALTEQGQAFFHYAQALVHEADQAEYWLKHKGRAPVDSISVGVSIEPLIRFVHAVIDDFRTRLPKVTLRLKQSVASQLLSDVREGRVEFAVLRLPSDFTAPDLSVVVLCDAESAVICRQGHPCARYRSIRDLAEQDWIVLGDQSLPGTANDSIRDLFIRHGLNPPRIAAVTDSFFGAISMLTQSNWLARLPRSVLDHPLTKDRFTAIPIAEKMLATKIAIVQKSTHHLTAEAQTLAAMLQSYARISLSAARAT